MIESSAILHAADAEVIARYFLYHLGADERRLLMADLPMVYARMYPGVTTERITGNVASGIALTRDVGPACQSEPHIGPRL